MSTIEVTAGTACELLVLIDLLLTLRSILAVGSGVVVIVVDAVGIGCETVLFDC